MRSTWLLSCSFWPILTRQQEAVHPPAPPNWPQYGNPAVPGPPPPNQRNNHEYAPPGPTHNHAERPAPPGHPGYPQYQQHNQYQQQQFQQQYQPPPAPPTYEHEIPSNPSVAPNIPKNNYYQEGAPMHNVNTAQKAPPGYPPVANPPIVPKGQFVNSSLVNVKLMDPSNNVNSNAAPGPEKHQQIYGNQYPHPAAVPHQPFYGAEYNHMVPPAAYPHQTLGGQYVGQAPPPPLGGMGPPGYVHPQPHQAGVWGGQPMPMHPSQHLKQGDDARALYESQAFVPMNNTDAAGESIATEWERVMTDFLPDMIVTFKLSSGESEHFHQDVGPEPVLIRGGFFESTDDQSSSITFQVVSPSGKVVYKSAKGEGLFKIQTEEAGTYTFALSNGNWSGLKYVTFVIGTGTERSLSQDDISTLDGNIKVLYRMLGDMETQSTYLWLRQKSHLEGIKKTATQTYYALIIELGCTAVATIVQLSVIKRMVSHRRLF